MGVRSRLLILAALALAAAVAGCALPFGGGPTVYSPVTPSPTPAPTPAPSPAPSATPAPATATQSPAVAPAGGNISHTYTWSYKDIAWSYKAVVQQAKYDLFKAKSHGSDISFASFAMAAEDRDLLDSTAAQFLQGGSRSGYTNCDEAMNAIAFVQSIPYYEDHPEGGPRYPLETLADGQGDCKDKSVLAAALLHEMGFDVVLLKFPNHVALGLNVAGAGGASYAYNGAQYYYVEMTSPGWGIGEVPDELKDITPTVLPLVKNPALQITVTTSQGDAVGGVVDCLAHYSVTNLGPGTARSLTLKIHALALSKGDNVAWGDEQTFDLNDLAEGHTTSGDALFLIPAGEPSRIVCIATGENVDRTQAQSPDFVAGQ